MRRQLSIIVLSIIVLLVTATLVLSGTSIFPYRALLASLVASRPQSPSSINLALNKPAKQSSKATVDNIEREAGFAVDGNLATYSQTLSHMDPTDAWWEVDLLGQALIDSVEINTGSTAFKLYYLYVSDVPFVSSNPDDLFYQPEVRRQFFNGSTTASTVLGWMGRYVRVQLKGDSTGTNTLRLAEVKVLGTPLSTNPRDVGQWSAIQQLPDIPVHMSLLPSGKVLFWGRDKRSDGYDIEGGSNVHLWDPISNTFTRKDNCRTNLFCSGHGFLPNGDLFVAGGSKTPVDNNLNKRFEFEGNGPRQTNIFDYESETWRAGPDMRLGRWYPSVATLSSGETLIVTGDYAREGEWNQQNDIPVYDLNTDTEIFGLNRTLLNIPNHAPQFNNYPSLHLGPNGRLLVVTRTATSSRINDDKNGLYYDPFTRTWVDETNLDLQQHHDLATSIMYEAGKVMVIGGRSFTQVSDDTEAIDLNPRSAHPDPWATAMWAAGTKMTFPRYYHTSVLMPNGQVFIVGGSKCGGLNNIRAGDIQDVTACTGGAVMNPEIFTPGTGDAPGAGVWSILARQQVIRMYHSVAMLMPDARILVAGGGRPGAVGEIAGGQRIDDITQLHARLFAHKEAEMFSPPYLFNVDGSQATRPVITSGPSSINYGQSFSVGISNVPANQIGQVVLIRLPSVTHGLNFDQRRVVLPAPTLQNSQTISVSAPADGKECPPGPYMLFVLGQNNVPSIAKIVLVGDIPVTDWLLATVTCDNSYNLFFNGSFRGSGADWLQAQTYNLPIQPGKNVVAIECNDAGGVAGLLAELSIAGQRIGSNATWKVSLTAPPNWTDVAFDDSGWANATEYGAYGVGPWGTFVCGMPLDTPARWIWSSNNDAHDRVYIRVSFAGPEITPPPSGLVATTVSNSRIDLTWTSPGVPIDRYEVERSQNISGPFTTVGTPSTTQFSDINLVNSVAYIYRVRAVRSGNSSLPSNIDLATAVSFTDKPLIAGVTVVKAQHIDELRVAVNAVRATAGLPLASWTDTSLTGVVVKAVHITEIRNNLNQALLSMGFGPPSYTDPGLSAGTVIRKSHVEDIRQAVR